MKQKIIGMDEAGRGPWAGPVVAAAVRFRGRAPRGLGDSKMLTEAKRELLYERILEKCDAGIGLASSTFIDDVGLMKATNLAFAVALSQIEVSNEKIIIDGRDKFALQHKYETLIKGDQKVKEIMAASIIAKVYRDRIMQNFDEKYPVYAFRAHKGYGTKTHQNALADYGICPIHRMSYKPIQAFL